MKNILYLEHNVDGTVGGSHFCLLEICRNLDRSRYQPIVCFYQENSLLPEFRESGAEVIVRAAMTPFRLRSTLFGRLNRPLQALINMLKALIVRTSGWCIFLLQQRIRLVHINNACGYDHDLMFAAWLLRIPCVVHERGIQPSLPPATQFFSNRIDRIITISDAVHRNLLNKEISPAKLLRINDGIDTARLTQLTPIEELRNTWNIPAGVPVIGIVGNIKVWKGQETVIRAMSRLQGDYPELRCLVVGSVSDPIYKERLDRIIDEHRLHKAVTFTGYQKRPTDLISLFDIVIHASVDPEPFGIVLLEAMGKAKPVIATKLGGPLEIVVDGETGYLTRPQDDQELAERITKLLNDADTRTRMGRHGQERLLEKYTIQTNISKIEALYTELLAG